MKAKHGDTLYVGPEPHHAARPMKVVEDNVGCKWLCDVDVDESKDLKAQGCWRCGELAFTRDD